MAVVAYSQPCEWDSRLAVSVATELAAAEAAWVAAAEEEVPLVCIRLLPAPICITPIDIPSNSWVADTLASTPMLVVEPTLN